jgi:hypothetical protein
MQYLITLQIWLVLFWCSLPDRDARNEAAREVTVVIENGSYLKINGYTNVNSFSCSYQGEIGRDTMNVRLTPTREGLALQHAGLSIEVDRFDCGNQMMNKDFRNLLEYEQHPQLKLNILSLQSTGPENPSCEALAKVQFTIAGTSETYEVPVNILEGTEPTAYCGEKALDITDFDLTPPRKFLGMVVVDKEVSIDFRINLRLL